MPSHKANKYGTACEYYLADHYNVRLVDEDGKRLDTSWYDGLKDGSPWEFKATAHRHADGQPGNFKIYRKYHEKLQRAGGRYGFAVVPDTWEGDANSKSYDGYGITTPNRSVARWWESPEKSAR